MAIDTRDKRASAIHGGSPWRGLLPLPDGALTQGDRVQVALHYRGITPVDSSTPPIGLATVRSLVPVRTAASLVPVRTMRSLTPRRRTVEYAG